MKKYKIPYCISFSAVESAYRECVDMEDFESKLDDLMCEFDAKRVHSNGNGMSYKDWLLAKEFFKIGFAAAHIEVKK